MPPSPEMKTFAGRLASFEGPKQLTKRRASSQKKKQPTTSSWPHDSPTPEQLAKAGFFYKPSSSSPDSVTCFLCSKALDGWDTDDNPALEHLNHVPNCGWAINCCIEQRIQDMDRSEEDPLSEKMVDARRGTYNDWWPHEKKKGWKCKTKKMIDAGWCYTPIPEADDCVTCFYCGASLEGWEPKDDPWQEHRKRAPDCHFFTLVEESAQLKKASKSKKGRTSRTSRASRQSVQSSTTTGVDDSLAQLEDDAATEEGDSMMSTATTTSKAGKSRKKTAKAKGTASRSKKSTQTASEPADESVVSQRLEAELERELEVMAAEEQEREESEKQTRSRKQTRSSTQSVSADPKPNTTRGRKAAAQPLKTAEQNKTSDMLEVEESEIAPTQPQRSTRGRKRLSDGSEKLESASIIAISPLPKISPQEEEPPENPKPKSTRAARKIVEQEEEEEEEDESPKPTKKSGKGRKKKQVAEEPENEAEEQIQIAETEEQEQDEGLESRQIVQEPQVRVPKPTFDEPRQQATPPPAEDDAPNHSPTPQSSDAENQPPSSARPLSKRKTPILPRPAQTPKTSPSKRNIIAGDQLPRDAWKPIDLEGVFLPSPSYAHLADKDSFNIDTIMQNITSLERELSVEDWIKKNAGQAEDRLRQECERMIGKFEDEGNRALNTMEGIECA